MDACASLRLHWAILPVDALRLLSQHASQGASWETSVILHAHIRCEMELGCLLPLIAMAFVLKKLVLALSFSLSTPRYRGG